MKRLPGRIALTFAVVTAAAGLTMPASATSVDDNCQRTGYVGGLYSGDLPSGKEVRLYFREPANDQYTYTIAGGPKQQHSMAIFPYGEGGKRWVRLGGPDFHGAFPQNQCNERGQVVKLTLETEKKPRQRVTIERV
ncbi:hypothetical protein [Actinomadura oligospora]|uniref:hypothetical protein n=1 Tax=Actinomadura oligospora TaxID=111804 RepID=UPI0004B0A908|nr:hypothetical protein [Actinomadura oligospora]